jgi:hypothetical protein
MSIFSGVSESGHLDEHADVWVAHGDCMFAREGRCEYVLRAKMILASSLTSKHALPTGNPHIGVLVTMSAFTNTRKSVQLSGPRD